MLGCEIFHRNILNSSTPVCNIFNDCSLTFLILFTPFRDFLYVNVEGTRKKPWRAIKAWYLNFPRYNYMKLQLCLILKRFTSIWLFKVQHNSSKIKIEAKNITLWRRPISEMSTWRVTWVSKPTSPEPLMSGGFLSPLVRTLQYIH